MPRPKKDPEQPTYYTFKLGNSAEIRKTLTRCANLAANSKLPLANIKCIVDVCKVVIQLEKVVELEAELEAIKDLLAQNYGEED